MHTHRAWWFDEQFKICKDTFSLGTIISIVDFVEHYMLQPQNEVQSQYYYSQQVTSFVQIAFMHAHDSTKQDKKIVIEYHFYISDDHSHLIEFLQGCFQLYYGNLRERYIRYNQYVICLENCTSQFKNARIFYRLSRMHVRIGVHHFWNFSEVGHGKGEHNGASACVKRVLAREELKYEGGAKLIDETTIVQWCNSTMRPGNQGNSTISRYFWLMRNFDVVGPMYIVIHLHDQVNCTH